MKYSLDRIETNPFHLLSIKNFLACSNCKVVNHKNLFYNQKCHNGCYCKDCINNCKQCYNRGKFEAFELLQMLSLSGIKCKNYSMGCKVIAGYNSIEEHEGFCNFNPIDHTWSTLDISPQEKPYFTPLQYSEYSGRNNDLPYLHSSRMLIRYY